MNKQNPIELLPAPGIGKAYMVYKKDDGSLGVATCNILEIGEFKIYKDERNTTPNRIWIFKKDGEGGEFSGAELEKVIEEFFKKQL